MFYSATTVQCTHVERERVVAKRGEGDRKVKSIWKKKMNKKDKKRIVQKIKEYNTRLLYAPLQVWMYVRELRTVFLNFQSHVSSWISYLLLIFYFILFSIFWMKHTQQTLAVLLLRWCTYICFRVVLCQLMPNFLLRMSHFLDCYNNQFRLFHFLITYHLFELKT